MEDKQPSPGMEDKQPSPSFHGLGLSPLSWQRDGQKNAPVTAGPQLPGQRLYCVLLCRHLAVLLGF